MPDAYGLVAALAPLNRVFCSEDNDRALDLLCSQLPFTRYVYPGPKAYNGWVAHPRWDPLTAQILQDGKVVYDALAHPLGLAPLSRPCRLTLGHEELLRHLRVDERHPDAIPYTFSWMYRPWARDWAMCMPRTLRDALPEGEYEVVIETREGPGDLTVLEYFHQGRSGDGFAFVAHLDHPGMANDDAAGVAVGVELLRRLKQRSTRFSYTLLVVPEMIGSEHYLGRTYPGSGRSFFSAMSLEMLGTSVPFSLKASRLEGCLVHRAAARVLETSDKPFRHIPHTGSPSNDELVFDAHGIPACSLARFPYPQYHCDQDRISIIIPDALEESIELLSQIVDELESELVVTKRFSGFPCLSNPAFGVFIDAPQPALGTGPDQRLLGLRKIMNALIETTRPMAIAELAAMGGVSCEVAEAYLREWEKRNLISIT
jgi:aminopeptidase-like protein